jgi:hypothetical protein
VRAGVPSAVPVVSAQQLVALPGAGDDVARRVEDLDRSPLVRPVNPGGHRTATVVLPMSSDTMAVPARASPMSMPAVLARHQSDHRPGSRWATIYPTTYRQIRDGPKGAATGPRVRQAGADTRI